MHGLYEKWAKIGECVDLIEPIEDLAMDVGVFIFGLERWCVCVAFRALLSYSALAVSAH